MHLMAFKITCGEILSYFLLLFLCVQAFFCDSDTATDLELLLDTILALARAQWSSHKNAAGEVQPPSSVPVEWRAHVADVSAWQNVAQAVPPHLVSIMLRSLIKSFKAIAHARMFCVCFFLGLFVVDSRLYCDRRRSASQSGHILDADHIGTVPVRRQPGRFSR